MRPRAPLLLALPMALLTSCPAPPSEAPAAAAAEGEHSSHAAPSGGTPRTPAVTVKPRRGPASLTGRAPGLAAWDATGQSLVTTQLGGQVRRLRVPRVGELVGKGAVVAEIYSPQARALFSELQVARGLGEPWLSATTSRLLRSGIPPSSIESSAGGIPETFPVRAPLGGVVIDRPVAEGSWVGPGATLAVLADAAAVVVDVVVTGTLPPVGTEATLADPATGETYPAVVEALLPQGDTAGTLVRLRPQGAPRVGRPLVAEWSLPVGEGLWVPRSAVVDTGERRLVFVVMDGVPMARAVALGARTADEMLVTEGLDGSEDVLASGTFLFDSETQVLGGGHAGMTGAEP